MSPTTETPEQLASTASLEALYPKLAEMQVCPGWNKPTPSLWPAPKKSFQPVRWSYAQAKGALDAAGRLIRTELAERRNLLLVNPVEGNIYATTKTIVSAYQMILAGERAPSHRHVPNALRLIVDAGEGAYTIVNGKKLPMLPGDVVLTPNWCWHGHGNEGDRPAYWIDFLDVPLVQLLEPMFFERHPNEFEKEEDDGLEVPENHQHKESSPNGNANQEKSAPEEAQEERKGQAVASRGRESNLVQGQRNPSASAQAKQEQPLAFPRQETEARLSRAKPDPTNRFGTQIELGRPALDTISLWMMKLEPGAKTAQCRTTANNIYAVVQGSGKTTIDNQTFAWQRGDVIAVPTWYQHHHQATEDAILFRVTDEPVMQKLGYLREE